MSNTVVIRSQALGLPRGSDNKLPFIPREESLLGLFLRRSVSSKASCIEETKPRGWWDHPKAIRLNNGLKNQLLTASWPGAQIETSSCATSSGEAATESLARAVHPGASDGGANCLCVQVAGAGQREQGSMVRAV